MRLLCLFVPLVAAQVCVTDSCLRALDDSEPTSKNGTADCLAALHTTSTPDASTIFRTLSVTHTATTTRNTTLTRAPSTSPTASDGRIRTAAGQPWKRWLAGREAAAQLANRAPGSALAYPTDAPSYASECGSPAAYVSACSCLGVTPAVVTAHTPLVISTVHVTAFTTSTSIRTRYANATARRNATLPAIFPNSTSGLTSLRATSLPTGSRRTSGVLLTSGARSTAASTGTPRSSGVAAGAPFANTTSPASLNTSSLNAASRSARYANSTVSTLRLSTGASSRPTGWALPNITAASAPFANSTARFNSTPTSSAARMSATAPPSTARSWNTTGPAVNATTARYWNTTAPRFNTTAPRNTSTTASPTSTATIDRTCGETAAAFGLSLAQPGGFVDGWRLRQSGGSVVLVRDAPRGSLFSVGASGRLCAVGREGSLGNAAVAVVEARRNSSADASPLWFVDGGLVANLTDLGYAELRCATPTAGGPLECGQDEMRNWMACGLQVTLSSGAEPAYEGIECKGAQLLVAGGNSTSGNGTVPRATSRAEGSATRGPVAPTSDFADVRRRQGWGFLLGPFFGLGSDGDI